MKKILLSVLTMGALVTRLEAQEVSTVVGGVFEPTVVSNVFEPYGVTANLVADAYYFTDSVNNRILKYDNATATLSVVVDGTAASGQLSNPSGIVFEQGSGAARLIVADTGNSLIRAVDPNSGVITALAGSSRGNLDGVGTSAQFNFPAGLALDPASGTVYVADALNDVLRSINSTNRVTTVETGFYKPAGVAVGDTSTAVVGGVTQTTQQIWVADTLNHVIWQLTVTRSGSSAPTWAAQIVAGQYRVPGSADSSDALSATFDSPCGLLWLGGQTGLLIADTLNNTIRQLSYNARRGSYSVSTLAGAAWPAQPALADGPLSASRFDSPVGLALDNEGAILVADLKNNALRKITRAALPAPTVTAGGTATTGGSFSNAVTVVFVNATAGATFHFTTDGSAPNALSPSANSITLSGAPGNAVALQYKAYSPDFGASSIISNYFSFFVADPIVSPAAATSDNAVTFTLTEATAGALLYWTINGTEPTATSSPVTMINGSGTLVITQNGTLNVKAFRDGFAASQTISVPVSLTCGAPVITPPGFTGNNSVNVTMTTTTTNAAIYWTIDGSEPTASSTRYSGPFTLSANGTLQAKAFRNGFVNSPTTVQSFNLVVADPLISPNGATNFNPVKVSFSDATTNAVLYWTIDGSDPDSSSASVPMANGSGSILLAQNGALKVRAFRNGFAVSQVISASFNLSVAPLVVTPVGALDIDSVTVSLSSATVGAALRYTLDGSAVTPASPLYAGPLSIVTNTVLTAAGSLSGFVDSPTVVNNYQIQVDTPSMNPQSGYFPSGSQVTFSVLRPDAVIYWTTTGQDPTMSDTVYTGPISIDQVNFPTKDLRILKARAFAPNTLPSAVVAGQSFSTNVVGVPRDFVGGVGASLVMPVVVNLTTNQILRSLQFRLEIAPLSASAPPLPSHMTPLNISTNDFVPLVGNSGVFQYSTYQIGPTSGVVYAALDSETTPIQNFGVVLNMLVPVPANAHPGDTYNVSVSQVSGTSDGAQNVVPLSPLPNRTLTISNLAYLVGDSALGRWYNAGDFGDGNLDNANVNNAFLASEGIHVPPAGTNVYNAMDAYPPDGPGFVGGDGQIRFLDWNTILKRSLRLDSQNWMRAHTTGGMLTNWSTSLDPSGLARPKTETALPPGQVWLRQAQIRGVPVANAVPGALCQVPVWVNVLPGYSLAGLQFRASLVPENGAPPVTQPLSFLPALAASPKLVTYLNDVLCAWPIPSGITPLLAGSNFLGYVQCPIPPNALQGQSYALQFSYCDGAPDMLTQYDLESFQALVWVASTPRTQPSLTSDEWKIHFFGSTDAVQAADAADPDGDGVPNWQEYLAGTDPTNRQSVLQLTTSVASNSKGINGVNLGWLSAPGKSYVVEACPTLNGTWSPVTTLSGDGNPQLITVTNKAGQHQFYRLRLQY